jgi:hypothetical protein
MSDATWLFWFSTTKAVFASGAEGSATQKTKPRREAASEPEASEFQIHVAVREEILFKACHALVHLVDPAHHAREKSVDALLVL